MKITASVDGSALDAQEVELKPGEAYTASFAVIATAPADTWTITAYNTATGEVDDTRRFTISVESAT